MNDTLQQWIAELDSDDFGVRYDARQALIHYDGDLTHILIALMLEQSGRASWQAAIILAHQHDERAIEPMKWMLTSPHPTLGQVAAEALAYYGSTYIDDLLRALPIARHMTQLAIISVLVALNNGTVVEPLLKFLNITDSSTAIYLTIRGLTRLGDPAALQVIRGFEAHEDYHVCESVNAAITKFTQDQRSVEEGNAG